VLDIQANVVERIKTHNKGMLPPHRESRVLQSRELWLLGTRQKMDTAKVCCD